MCQAQRRDHGSKDVADASELALLLGREKKKKKKKSDLAMSRRSQATVTSHGGHIYVLFVVQSCIICRSDRRNVPVPHMQLHRF